MKEGQGTFTWADGRKYIGLWKAGKQHGEGFFIFKNGLKKKGEWIEGKRKMWIGEEEIEQI